MPDSGQALGRATRAAICCATLVAQASSEIPEDELLDVAVHTFDPGVPPAIAKNEQAAPAQYEQALNKKRIYPIFARLNHVMLHDVAWHARGVRPMGRGTCMPGERPVR